MLDAVFLARWQFALTSIYHWLFVPLTLGMTVSIAVMEWFFVSTGKEIYQKMAKLGWSFPHQLCHGGCYWYRTRISLRYELV